MSVPTPDGSSGLPADGRRAWHATGRVVRRLQHMAAAALNVDEDGRIETVITMLKTNVRRAPGYWIQLFLSMGIATLGLVLGSTAVVIGGMLVSPLMGPIVELGMGLAVGSSLLVFRATLRVVLSVGLVIFGAALITAALPFHEVTSEIASRTAPTALDLLVAVFCALAAAYTTVRPGSDTASAAAGTAIGIALVPPLCTVGFGLGTLSATIGGGAMLLFVANFSSILVIAVGSFVLLGFDMVDAATLEQEFTPAQYNRTDRIATTTHRALRDAFGSRYSFALRLLIPVAFLATVYVPLSRALDEVSWEVRTREAIRDILSDEQSNSVQTNVVVERQSVAVRLMLLGSSEAATNLERRLEMRIAAVAGVKPTVSVMAVPDARAFAASAVAQARAGRAFGVTFPMETVRQRLREALESEWPQGAAGPLLRWELRTLSSGVTTITTHHLGPPLGIAAESLLTRALSSQLGHVVAVRDSAIAADTVRLRGDRAAFAAVAAALLREVARADSSSRVVACVRRPVLLAARDSALAAAIDSTAAARQGRVLVREDSSWSVRAALGDCPG